MKFCFIMMYNKFRQKNKKSSKKVLTLKVVCVIIKKYRVTDEKKYIKIVKMN